MKQKQSCSQTHKFQQQNQFYMMMAESLNLYEKMGNVYHQSHKQKQFYETPGKKQQQNTAEKTLRKNVMERISSGKHYSANKNQQTIKYITTKQTSRSDNDEEDIQLKQLVLDNQSPTNPGFYQYVHWIKLHTISFAYVDKKYMENLWKILRLINYGEVLIPTGLIYQLICNIKRGNSLGRFEKIINGFLTENQTSDSLKGFKDIKNYIPLIDIEKAYKGITNQKQVNKQNLAKMQKNKWRSQSSENIFNRMFSQAKILREKRAAEICKSIAEESKKYYSKPKISVYKCESVHSLFKPERICHQTEKYKYKSEEEKYMQECHSSNDCEKLFRAKLLDKSIFEGDVCEIPGVASHIKRNHFSQAQKLRLKRQSEKPHYSKKKIY